MGTDQAERRSGVAERARTLYRRYRQRHPGVTGIRHLVFRVFQTIANGGLSHLRQTIIEYRKAFEEEQKFARLPAPNATLALNEIDPSDPPWSLTIAVHAHIYYVDLAPEIREYIENIPAPYQLFVTTDTREKAECIAVSMAGVTNAHAIDIRVVPNRGRDIGPMLVELGEVLSGFDVVLHIHTKRSPHNPDLRGWRRYLFQSLLGGRRRVAAILDQFEKDEQLGCLYPQIYLPVIPYMRIGGNAGGIGNLLARAGRSIEELRNIDMSAFPAGFMLWFRGKAIGPFLRMKLQLDEFEIEAGQDDSTLAHAIERSIPYFAAMEGYTTRAFLPVQMISPSAPGAVPLAFLRSIGLKAPETVCLLFEGDIAADNAQLRRAVIDAAITNGQAVYRIYRFRCGWILEWIAADDGMICAESELQHLLSALSTKKIASIIVNGAFADLGTDHLMRQIAAIIGSSESSHGTTSH